MTTKRLGIGASLVAMGAAVGIGATHVHSSWNPEAHAAPPAVAAATMPSLPPPSPTQVNEQDEPKSRIEIGPTESGLPGVKIPIPLP